MQFRLCLIALACAVLFGCQNRPEPVKVPQPAESKATEAAPAPNKPAPNTTDPAPKPEAPSMPQEKPMEIVKPGTNGWKPAPAPKSDIQTFAEHADQTVATVAGAEVEARMLVENAKMSGNIDSKLRLKDRTTYAVEYQLPDNPADTLTYRGKDGKRVQLTSGKWVADNTKLDASSAMIALWPHKFTEYVTLALAKRTPIWKELIANLNKPNSGYSTSLEYQTLPMGAQQVKFARLLVTNQKDPQRTWEMRFEARQALPVTIKIVDKDAAGKPYKVQWNLQWFFDRKIDEALFEIPNGSN